MLENFTIESLIQGYKDNKFSVSEVVSDYYDRIAKVNSDYNVYVSLCRDLAEQRVSKISEYNIDKDLLYGVPLGLKDLFSYKDSSLTAGSKILKGFKPSYNAVSTQRILDQGGIVLGMVNTDEFACGASNETSAYGPVHNPYDREYVSGGSSGGSAA